MKPVNKPPNRRTYSPYDTAKPALLHALGGHCSYCERAGAPQDLHVEHIYPAKAHPAQATKWNNFLVACNTCNTYKRLHLGDGRQRSLLKRYLWPHTDNTASAFHYKSTGNVEIAATVPAHLVRAAELTRDMAGLLLSPAKASGYAKLGVAYDGTSRRSQVWRQASGFRQQFLQNPTAANAVVIANGAASIGYFSIWMEVFTDQPVMRRELIRAFQADQNCFDPATTAPVQKGRL
jgi:uncharacterized protein (TIGR02646 family)